jgi:hypothetical protein
LTIFAVYFYYYYLDQFFEAIMSDLRMRQAGAPPMSPSAQVSIALGALLIIGGMWFFKSSFKVPVQVTSFTRSVMKSFH